MNKKIKFCFMGTLVITGVIFFLLGMGSSPDRGKADEASPVSTIVIKDEGGFATQLQRLQMRSLPLSYILMLRGPSPRGYRSLLLVMILFSGISLVLPRKPNGKFRYRPLAAV